MNDIELVQTKEYDGTLRSLEEMVHSLKLKDDFHHYNLSTGEVKLSNGLCLKPGDSYQIKIHDKVEVIG